MRAAPVEDCGSFCIRPSRSRPTIRRTYTHHAGHRGRHLIEAGYLMAWPTSSRHARGYGTAHDKMREHLKRTVILCEECKRKGCVTEGTIADHIRPLAQGGSSGRSNYQLLCRPCSDAKGLVDKGQRAKPQIGKDGWPV